MKGATEVNELVATYFITMPFASNLGEILAAEI